MSTLEKMTQAWKVAVGSDSGLGDHVVRYDLKADGVIVIDRNGVSNEDRPADVTFSGDIDVVDAVLTGRLAPTKALLGGGLKVSPMDAAVRLRSEIEALVSRFPKADADAPALLQEEPEAPLPPRSPEMRLFTPDMWDHETPDSFVPLEGASGILIRDIDTARRFTDGRALVRVLRADPAAERRQAPVARAAGPKLCLVLSGEGVLDIEGQGELILKENDSWTVPTGNAQSLLDASADFSLLEFEFPVLAEGTSGTEATAEMFMRFGPNSYEPIPNFDGALQRDLSALRDLTRGGAHATALRGNPPHIWDGSPWHMHMQEIQLAYHMKGEMTFDFEGVGRIQARPGTFWFQQTFGRHREVLVSTDFEGLNVDIPAAAPTTVFIYDKELGTYTPTTYGSTDELSEKAGDVMGAAD